MSIDWSKRVIVVEHRESFERFVETEPGCYMEIEEYCCDDGGHAERFDDREVLIVGFFTNAQLSNGAGR